MRTRLVALSAFVLAGLAVPAFAADDDCRVIVGFKGTPSATAIARIGADSDDVDTSLRIAVVNVKASKIAALRADADVAYVEEDGIVDADAKGGKPGAPKPPTSPPPQPAQTTPWGVTKVWGGAQPAANGLNVKVAVIDTGIDLTHPDLQANIKGSVSYVSFTTGDDDHGHGSHVAGTIAAIPNTIGVIGVAPNASLYAVKVLDRNGSGYISAVAAGIDWSRTNAMHIANMSLGGGDSITMHNACDAAQAAGVLLVAAAGNGGDGSTATTELSYPGAYTSCVGVGATDINDNLASFSNTGSFVDVSGPGVSVPSTYKDGGYATFSGTSMASPHAAGLAALLWTPGVSTEATVRAALLTHVRDKGPAGYDNGFGYGIVYYP
jgi:subtilisin family serine protease